MRKYLLFVIVTGLLSALAFTSCTKESEDTFPVIGTTWIGESWYDAMTNHFYNGDIEYILKMTGEGTGTLMTIDNHTARAAITITAGSPVTWTLNGTTLNLTTSKESLKGELDYSNRNINFMRTDSTYLAFDKKELTNALATKVFRGTFTKVGTTVKQDVVFIFLSAKGFKMMVPSYPVTTYPLSQYTVDNSGKLLIHYFAGIASSSVPLDFTNHSGNYTASNDSIVYTTTNVPVANTYPNSLNWRGVFRLKEVK
jgi:hypothetical protein